MASISSGWLQNKMHSLPDRCRYTSNLNGSAVRESRIDLPQLVAQISRRSRRR